MRVSVVAGHIRQANEITFILGAGASIKAGIPLAAELVKQINSNYGHCLSNLSEDERKNYGRVMAALSPGIEKY